ncbi:MAG: HDIG domain-containing protein [Desulfobacterales bacterium]|jgi:uncharacterized protein|nr:HDIG domain-containing protein [Desulfobacterales bacterium]
MVDPIEIIKAYYPPESKSFGILLAHGQSVAAKALSVANRLSGVALNRTLIEEAALLHDIGIFMTRAPDIGCFGNHPYICHGYFGRQLLEKIGLFEHARVCERHVGVGISAEEIRWHQLPLPERDMRPVSLEEEIICYADKFFSKSANETANKKSVEEIVRTLTPYGKGKVTTFLSWVNRFGG